MFSIQHFEQIADITHFHFFSFSTGEFHKTETTFKSGETENPAIFCVYAACCTATHVLTNLNIGGPTEIVYSLFCTNYEI